MKHRQSDIDKVLRRSVEFAFDSKRWPQRIGLARKPTQEIRIKPVIGFLQKRKNCLRVSRNCAPKPDTTFLRLRIQPTCALELLLEATLNKWSWRIFDPYKSIACGSEFQTYSALP
jgi:hypothetical protein